ncbi:hypothetical protein B0H63DRAFT_547606 [Podospora didyma]|uniref:Uncharacterized protein n=1 Tax=Podospora didyma TaxID=330526 RepID=A0AAE0NBU5_9PEZI|nr:hypothetical protein B0H63DRAFT_547606 [Podospora didyma]
MSVLLPVPGSDMSATYDYLTQTLTVEAKGTIQGWFAGAFVKKDIWFGGLRYSIRGFSNGVPPIEVPDFTTIDAKYKDHIHLPLDHFNSKNVTVETGLGTFYVEIVYLMLGVGPVKTHPTNGYKTAAAAATTTEGEEPSAVVATNGTSTIDEPAVTATTTTSSDNADTAVGGKLIKDDSIVTDVLPPIHQNLLAPPSTLQISSPIPVTIALPEIKAYIDISFNPVFFRLLDTRYAAGSIIWTVGWAKLPLGLGENPQPIDVITTVVNQADPKNISTSRNVQSYFINFVVLAGAATEKAE